MSSSSRDHDLATCAATPKSAAPGLRQYLTERRAALIRELAEIRIAQRALAATPVVGMRIYGHREHTIKARALQALRNHEGGLSSEGVRSALGDVTRASLTPQLSRLKAEGALGYADGRWFATGGAHR